MPSVSGSCWPTSDFGSSRAAVCEPVGVWLAPGDIQQALRAGQHRLPGERSGTVFDTRQAPLLLKMAATVCTWAKCFACTALGVRLCEWCMLANHRPPDWLCCVQDCRL
jgi:hypothetical protein